jgi:hypothetical protein
MLTMTLVCPGHLKSRNFFGLGKCTLKGKEMALRDFWGWYKKIHVFLTMQLPDVSFGLYFCFLPTFSMARAKVTPSEVTAFKKMHKNGRSFAEIARLKGWHRHTVRRYCTGEVAAAATLESRIKQAVKKLRKKYPKKRNIGCVLVARELGMGHNRIAVVMRGMDIPARKQKLWLHPNRAEDPEKVCSQANMQGW